MSKKKGEVCPHCGAKVVEYRHGFNKVLASALIKLSKAPGPVAIKDLGMSHSELANLQKLSYWSLIENPRLGVWGLTENGRRFMDGRSLIHEFVWSYRGEFRRFEGDLISFKDRHPNPDQRPDYQEQVRKQLQRDPL